MYQVVGQCPVCGDELSVTRLHCRTCDTTIEGRFALDPAAARFTPEQWAFAETFIRCGGKINRVEKELDLSYPAVRARLDDLILALGYDPHAEAEEDGKLEENAGVSEEERRRILDDLAKGNISSEEAMRRLRNG